MSRNKMALGLQLPSNSTWDGVYTHIFKFVVREKIHQSKQNYLLDLKSIKGLSVVLAKFSLNFKPFESKKKSFKQKILMQNVKSLFRFSGDRRHLELMCDHAQNEFDNLASPILHYTDVNHCLSHCPSTSQPTWDGST